jgi:type IV secretion system protein VirB5
VALLQALSQDALGNASGRFASVQQLIDAIPSARDQKGILDLQARIGAEQGMLQNEQTKLQVLYQTAVAQDWATQQRAREQVIAAQGDFATRFEPTPQ